MGSPVSETPTPIPIAANNTVTQVGRLVLLAASRPAASRPAFGSVRGVQPGSLRLRDGGGFSRRWRSARNADNRARVGIHGSAGESQSHTSISMSVAMKKYPLAAKWRYPLVAR